MMKLLSFSILIFLSIWSIYAGGEGARDWTYVHKSSAFKHENWHKAKGARSCNGHRQSPININDRETVYRRELKSLDISYKSGNMEFKNVGSTVKMKLQFSQIYRFKSMYKNIQIVQMHWHWGSDNDRGSEHTIDHYEYPIEGHIVGFDADRFWNFQDALHGKDSLYVLGVLYEVGEENLSLKQITDQLKNIRQPNSKVELSSISIKSLLPSDTSRYYRYKGSLTTPPCFENVVWTVFADPVSISREQLEEFRSVYYGPPDEPGTKMVNNYRPTQKFDGVVFSSFYE